MERINFTEERRLKAAPGMLMLFVSLIVTLLGIPAYIAGFAYSGPSRELFWRRGLSRALS